MSAVNRPFARHPGHYDSGFTLVELLVVVVVIGILIAIAIPLYLNYKRGAADKSAQSDLRGAVSALEQCYVDNTGYPSALAAAGGTPTGCSGQSVKVSSGTTYAYFPKSATDLTAFILSSTNSAGTGKTFCFSSSTGGAIATTATAVTAWRSPC